MDQVDSERIRLAATGAPGSPHQYVPLSAVERVGERVHLSTTAAAALAGVGDEGSVSPLPPVKNRSVKGARPRGNFYLPWLIGIVGLILFVMLLHSCFDEDGAVTAGGTDAIEQVPPARASAPPATLPVELVTLPDGQMVDLEPGTINHALRRYLASSEAAPRTFAFDKMNFDTGSATIRTEDEATVNALARILQAYPRARVRIVGYTDARGTDGSNDQLGAERATAVKAALVAKGVDAGRIEAATAGESDPARSNATTEGQFENRRTELVVLAK